MIRQCPLPTMAFKPRELLFEADCGCGRPEGGGFGIKLVASGGVVIPRIVRMPATQAGEELISASIFRSISALICV